MPEPPNPKIHDHPHRRQSRYGQRRTGGPAAPPPPDLRYAELAVTSNYTFLTGASHPDELVTRAAELGHRAIALTDRNTLAGVVRAHVAAQEVGIDFITGCRLVFTEPEGLSVLVYPQDRAAYGRLCTLLTLGKRRAPKGQCFLALDDLIASNEGLLAVISPPPHRSLHDETASIRALARAFDDDRLSIAVTRLHEPEDEARVQETRALARDWGIPTVAINDVYYHIPHRRLLQDVLTCIQHGCTLPEAGFRLFANGERYLKTAEHMDRLFADCPEAVARTVEIADRALGFSLDQLRYEYADETCPPGMTPMAYLQKLTWEGAAWRYPGGVPAKVKRQIEHEFALIEELAYAPYFLTVHDLVSYARSLGILCQGRGAAANSAVCFCLGITSVDPDRIDVLFERFVSRERNEPPDIDIDFEHERREEVIQYIYRKYGRDRAGLTAEVITYRGRSAVRDVGKALGLSLDAVDRLAKRIHHWGRSVFDEGGEGQEELKALGFNPDDATMQWFVKLAREIVGFPRHLSQHVGGFVITRGPLCELVPIENAAMQDRTVIEWDKDDIDAMGILKVDVLGLGMLTCIRKALSLIEQHHGQALTLATIPAEDPAVYELICDADTLGVFQIESRAQMTMLPRLKPRCFYDLVIEVAIVRPGPIVGDMVHPFLRRRHGEEPVIYPDEKIEAVLGKTLGIPLFQEQAMSLAIVAAGFTPGEAEALRRAVTAWKSAESMARHARRFVEGMVAHGYERAFAEQCFARLKGFSEYGFPESHAASFALLVYASAWIKRYYPAAFAAALINSQPMGFYAPSQIVHDAESHGVETRAVDVNHSQWDCTLEDGGTAVRLGMRLVKGLRECDAQAVARAVKERGPLASPGALWRASAVRAASLCALAQADAFGSMGLDRQHALWAVQALPDKPLPLFDGAEVHDRDGTGTALPPVSRLQQVTHDYRSVGLSLKDHPLSFLRALLAGRGVITAAEMKDTARSPHGRMAAVAGIVLFRQRPATAKGTMFMTLEDETGRADLIIRPAVYERCRSAVFHGQVVLAYGRVERQGRVVHVLAQNVDDIGTLLTQLPYRSRDFR